MEEYEHTDGVATREFKRLRNEIERRNLIIAELRCEYIALKKNGTEVCEKHQTRDVNAIAGAEVEQHI